VPPLQEEKCEPRMTLPTAPQSDGHKGIAAAALIVFLFAAVQFGGRFGLQDCKWSCSALQYVGC
jgi:hypothetical protein